MVRGLSGDVGEAADGVCECDAVNGLAVSQCEVGVDGVELPVDGFELPLVVVLEVGEDLWWASDVMESAGLGFQRVEATP